MFWPIFIGNIYWCYNTFLLINYRDDKYYEVDYLIAYNNYFFDFYFNLWKDLFNNLRISKGKNPN